ncbi:Flagellum-specific ATPase FliI [Rickettsiales endosymbiont of Paramecium tredecaurelia]|uniref:flagellar protein export ATPase FliI n=1 Tax=Candidatus Sarmatiella mevalonica TaxID=2770581 RepID=UPI001921EDF0|nr:flagellar protein export ATPase FliI [Candidatus Sarmatiella mevalonica]MBL3284811.1 Flagellum-specific ATPase FliI [Candidatus Sarmatiella mevalonica]
MSFIRNIEAISDRIQSLEAVKTYGKVTAVSGTLIKCRGLEDFTAVGSRCKIKSSKNSKLEVMCEIVGFDEQTTYLMSFFDTEGIGAGDYVEVISNANIINPHISWVGRIINGFGEPIDKQGPLTYGSEPYQLRAAPPSSHARTRIGGKIDLGVKAIDVFTPCCYGQRMGIFAGSGVGKSVLISMLTKYAHTDIKVIGLLGERGREVKEFIEESLGPEGLAKAILVVATGDESPLLRKRAAFVAMAIAEYFRDQGKEVLCILDSVTRFAMAQREIGLAIKEPPTTKGYTPSVFSELPRLLERAGPGTEGVHITGLFTVLVDGDDHNEPIADAVRGILDGHIILDRSIAERGRFPAMDVLRSVSRAMPHCNNELENRQVTFARRMMSVYSNMAEMIRLGAYKKGSDREVDEAIKYWDQLEDFLKQAPNQYCNMHESYMQLGEIIGIVS